MCVCVCLFKTDDFVHMLHGQKSIIFIFFQHGSYKSCFEHINVFLRTYVFANIGFLLCVLFIRLRVSSWLLLKHFILSFM